MVKEAVLVDRSYNRKTEEFEDLVCYYIKK